MTIKKSIIETICNNSLIIYANLLNKKIKADELYNMIINKNINITSYSISNKRLNEFKNNYTKRNIFEKILYFSDKQFFHLKEIINIVNLDNIVEYSVTDILYNESINVYYANLIFDNLLYNYYDHDNAIMISKAKEELINIEKKINIKIINNINDYYINMITK